MFEDDSAEGHLIKILVKIIYKVCSKWHNDVFTQTSDLSAVMVHCGKSGNKCNILCYTYCCLSTLVLLAASLLYVQLQEESFLCYLSASQNFSNKTLKRTRKFVVEGVEVSVTTSKIISDDEKKDEEMRFLRYVADYTLTHYVILRNMFEQKSWTVSNSNQSRVCVVISFGCCF